MVKIVGKIDIENGNKKKLNSFKTKIIEVLEKYHKTTLALGKVLHEMDPTLKNDIKELFPKYKIPKEMRKSKNETFNWPLFIKDNLAPEFEVELDVQMKGGDILYYHPEKGDVTYNIVESDSISSAANDELPQIQIISDTETQKVEKTQSHNMNQSEINELLKKLLEELNEGLYEKERSIRLTLLAILAGESTFMLGEPGTAKSLVARRVSEAFEEPENPDEIKFFDYLMNQFSTPEEVFGPVSISELKNDNYVRKTEKYLPKAQFAFLDEIWKANPAIQNALLTILNEKIFRNGTKIEHVPLIGFMSASNELPAKDMGLEAIFDRFLVRVLEKPVSDDENFRKMISAGQNMQVIISNKLKQEIVDQIIEKSENVEISNECFNVIQSVRKAIADKNNSIKDESEKFIVSDRRWKKIANLMRVSAYCNNRKETDIMDATLIADCIWSTEQQEEDAKKIVAEAIKTYGVGCKSDVKLMENEVNEFEKWIDENFYQKEKTKEEKKVTIKSRNYFEVKDEDGTVCYIACNSHREYSGQRKYYYFKNDRSSNEPMEKLMVFDSETKTYTDSHNYRKYHVQFDTKESLKPRDFSDKTRSKNVENAERDAVKLRNAIEDEIKKIEDEVKNQEINMGNLFADADYYGQIVFREHINCKTQFDKLLKELDKQRQRYDR